MVGVRPRYDTDNSSCCIVVAQDTSKVVVVQQCSEVVRLICFFQWFACKVRRSAEGEAKVVLKSFYLLQEFGVVRVTPSRLGIGCCCVRSGGVWYKQRCLVGALLPQCDSAVRGKSTVRSSLPL